MASIQARVSRGKKYWSIVESRRVNGQPRTFILEYLGTAQTLLQRLQDQSRASIQTYTHGDTAALTQIARELDIVSIINKHVPIGKRGDKPVRDDLTVGASFLLAAMGRACQPTSKMGWYEWCKTTSLEYCLKLNLKGMDSQHFWDQMSVLPEKSIPLIEEEIVKKAIDIYGIKLDCLFFDTTNFFTFIDSANTHCDIPQRGRNKQKRFDLRQVGMALLVTRQDQFPLFHQTYRGNKNDIVVFKEVFESLCKRLKKVSQELSDVTLVFDKGNNSKDNFALLDSQEELHYVGGLVSSYFKDLIREANKNFQIFKINDEDIPVYRIKEKIWGKQRTCVITISAQLKEGQIKGIHQHLEKKYKKLETFKKQLENPKKKKIFNKEHIKQRLTQIIKGQFIEDILKYEFIKMETGAYSFTYHIDSEAFDQLKNEILGRKILFTNRHEWTNEEIILAYRGQAKVEYAFRNLKNPCHLAVRPQYHWTDQKIQAHILMCIMGYLLSVVAYTKITKATSYKRNLPNFMNDLKSIRLALTMKKKSNKVQYQLEKIPKSLIKITQILGISNESIRLPIHSFSDYI